MIESSITNIAEELKISPSMIAAFVEDLGITQDTKGAGRALKALYTHYAIARDRIKETLDKANWNNEDALVDPLAIAFHYDTERNNVMYRIKSKLKDVKPIYRDGFAPGGKIPHYYVKDVVSCFENWNDIRDPRGRKAK